MKPNQIIIAVTGKRPAGIFPKTQAYEESAWDPIYRTIHNTFQVFSERYECPLRRVITGGAQGVDQTAAWAAVDVAKQAKTYMDVALYRPFPEQDRKWLKTGLFGQQQYQNLLTKVDMIYTCPQHGQTINQLYMHRNIMMVDDANLLLAVAPPDSLYLGGTGYAVKYAKSQNMPILWLNTETLQVTPLEKG